MDFNSVCSILIKGSSVFDKAKTIVPDTKLGAGNEATRFTYVSLNEKNNLTHLRINMLPDGGIARIRVHGIPKIPKLQKNKLHVNAKNPEAEIALIINNLNDNNVRIKGVKILNNSLEDVFLELTGHSIKKGNN